MNKIKVELNVSDDDIENILCSAFEGGINYWTTKVEIVGDWLPNCEYASEQCAKGGELRILDECDEKRSNWHTLTKEKVLEAISKYIAHEFWSSNYGTLSEGVDAIGADIIVQLAIFGDVIYG